jgi:hypothetical protein
LALPVVCTVCWCLDPRRYTHGEDILTRAMIISFAIGTCGYLVLMLALLIEALVNWLAKVVGREARKRRQVWLTYAIVRRTGIA